MSFTVERDFVSGGLRCVCIAVQGMGHRCGYVGVPKSHPDYAKDYDDVDVDVHGGLTYGDNSEGYPVAHDGLWWFGFDCAHHGDTPDPELQLEEVWRIYAEHRLDKYGTVKTVEYVEEQCRHLAEQLAAREGE